MLRSRVRLGRALARALLLYWLVLLPCARRELRRWIACAAIIDDSHLRALALGKLSSEALVAEGAAVFAVLAAPAHRIAVVRAAVAYEVLYDAVDAIGEQPSADPLSHNRAVHAALVDAISPYAPLWHRVDPLSPHPDCPYLAALVHACRVAVRRLPAHRAVLSPLRRFASRAAEAQSLNHAGPLDDFQRLERWARDQSIPHGLWWEIAAAASDPLGVFALLAAASDQRTQPFQVTAIEQAYFPWIGALVWLMESMVDQRDDASSGNHSYVGRYGSPECAARRLATIAERAGRAAGALPRGTSHSVLLAGVASLYLSDPGARTREASAAAAAIRDALGWPVTALLLVLRLRRRLG